MSCFVEIKKRCVVVNFVCVCFFVINSMDKKKTTTARWSTHFTTRWPRCDIQLVLRTRWISLRSAQLVVKCVDHRAVVVFSYCRSVSLFLSLSPSVCPYVCLPVYLPGHTYTQFEGILPKGLYLPCVSMALLAGYPRYVIFICLSVVTLHGVLELVQYFFTQWLVPCEAPNHT